MKNLTSIIKTLSNTIGQNSPVILTGIAVTGVVTSIILAVRATPKAVKLIDDAVLERIEDTVGGPPIVKSYGMSPEAYSIGEKIGILTKKEVFKLTWKCYVPTVVVGGLTIASIIGAHNVHLRRQAALASLYSLTESAFKEYQNKVVEQIGKNKELKVRDDVTADTIKNNPISDKQVIFTGKGETLFYDQMSGRYFKGDIEKIRRIQNKINKDLISEDFMSLNELYHELGLSPIKLGEEMGWHLDHGMLEIRFSAQLTENEEPCIALDYELVPRYAYGQ